MPASVGYRPYVRGRRPSPVGGLGSVTYNPAAAAYFAAMTVQPDAARKSLLSQLIVGLQTDGVWALLDWFSVIAAHDAQAARINAKTPSQVAAVNGSLTFTTDRGYVSDAATGYLETSVADNAAGNWTQDSATMFSYANVAPVVGGSAIGLSASAATRLVLNPAGSVATARIHVVSNISGTTTSSLGLISAVRTSSTNGFMYRNGVLDGTSATSASIAPVASTFQFFRSNGAFLDVSRLAIAGWGGTLSATQNLALYTRINTYLTAVGGA